jgi:hypothetical protein
MGTGVKGNGITTCAESAVNRLNAMTRPIVRPISSGLKIVVANVSVLAIDMFIMIGSLLLVGRNLVHVCS